MSKVTVKDLDVKGKHVTVRGDFNVPHKDGVITDDNRVRAALPTINYLTENGAKVLLLSHLGKVKSEEDKAKNDMSIVADCLASLQSAPVKFVNETRGAELEEAVANQEEGSIVLMQNTRYEDLDGKKESGNDEELGKYWASLGDYFVEDAFGSVHRAHASTVGIATHLPSALGFLVEKEVNVLGKALNDPEISQIAWEKYGFRTGVTGGNYDVSNIGVSVPQTISSTVSSLKMDTYNRLIDYLKNN